MRLKSRTRCSTRAARTACAPICSAASSIAGVRSCRLAQPRGQAVGEVGDRAERLVDLVHDLGRHALDGLQAQQMRELGLLAAHLLLDALARGDIAIRADDAQCAAVRRPSHHLTAREDPAVLAASVRSGAPIRSMGRRCSTHVLVQRGHREGQIFGMDAVRQLCRCGSTRPAVAEELGPALVEHTASVFASQSHSPSSGRPQRQRQAFLHLAALGHLRLQGLDRRRQLCGTLAHALLELVARALEGRLGALVVGDVDREHDDADDLAVLVARRNLVGAYPALLARAGAQGFDDAELRLGRSGLLRGRRR